MKPQPVMQKALRNAFTAWRLFAALALSLWEGDDAVGGGGVDVIRILLPT